MSSRFMIAAWLSLALSAQAAWLTPARAQSGAGAESLDVPSLLAEVARNEKAMLARRLEYTWTSTTTYRYYDRLGRLIKEIPSVYEVYPVRGEFAHKLVSVSGKPVSRERAGEELKKAGEHLEKAARAEQKPAEATAAPAQAQGSSDAETFGFSTAYREIDGSKTREISVAVWRFFQYCEFQAPRRESCDGREAIVLDFSPRADFRPAGEVQKPYARLRGRVWIDAADRVVSRLEAMPADAHEPEIVIEHARITEGVWLERFMHIDTRYRPSVFNELYLDLTKEATDFKHFSSLAGDDRVDAPTEKP